MSAITGHLLQFNYYYFIMLTLTVDTVFVSILSPLSVNMVLWTVTGAISLIIVNIYTNRSVDTSGCYKGVFIEVWHWGSNKQSGKINKSNPPSVNLNPLSRIPGSPTGWKHVFLLLKSSL